MNLPCFGRTMHEKLLLSGTGHSETADPVDASNCLILLSDRRKRWLLNQRRPVLFRGATVTSIITKQAATAAVPDSNGTASGCCDWLLPPNPRGRVYALGGELQCSRWRLYTQILLSLLPFVCRLSPTTLEPAENVSKYPATNVNLNCCVQRSASTAQHLVSTHRSSDDVGISSNGESQ
jgi:hypothetical protein